MKPGNRSIRQRTTRLNERILYFLRSYPLFSPADRRLGANSFGNPSGFRQMRGE